MTAEFWWIRPYWLKVPIMHMAPYWPPGPVIGNRSPGSEPRRVVAPQSQIDWRPVAQYRQVPQFGMKEQTTWSPGATRVTPGPTCSTMPAPSWPSTMGVRVIMSPVMMWRSEWHRPEYRYRMRISPVCGSSSSSSSISRGLPGS